MKGLVTGFAIVLLGTLFSVVVRAAAIDRSNTADGCDWNGSGLEYKEEERSIRPVYLRCQQGSLRWKYPRGALRVVLQHGTSGKEFKGCIRAFGPSDTDQFQGARVYVEGQHQLHLILSPKDGKATALWRCFASVHGQVALYIEADASSLQRQAVRISYHLTPQRDDPDRDCSPCSDEELLRNYCTADFLAIGEIIDAKDNHELSRSEVRVRAIKVLADRWNMEDAEEEEEQGVGLSTKSLFSSNGREATVYVPLECGVRRATKSEQFLVMGRMVLGEPRLVCAPRMQQWSVVRETALKLGTNQCNLD